MVILNGLLFGVVLMFLIGPVFFTLIQTSLEKGFKKAIWVAVGISISDSAYILLAYLGLSQFIKEAGYNSTIGYIGGAVLILFGVYYLVKRQKKIVKGTRLEAKGRFRYIIKGLIINGVSPFVLVFWIGAMSLATVEYEYSGRTLVIFFAVIIAVVFSTDLLKAYLAVKIRKFMTGRVYKLLNIAVGIILILFGVQMLVYEW